MRALQFQIPNSYSCTNCNTTATTTTETTELCLLSNNIHDYHIVSQGKTTIPSVDDGEEMQITDVRIGLMMLNLPVCLLAYPLLCLNHSHSIVHNIVHVALTTIPLRHGEESWNSVLLQARSLDALPHTVNETGVGQQLL